MIINFNEPLYLYDRFILDAKILAQQYSEILKISTIGTSHDHRDLVMLELGTGRQYMLCVAGVHGRETVNPIVLMKIIEYYAQLFLQHNKRRGTLHKQQGISIQPETNYEQTILSDCIYELLHTFTILFIPLLNPDGYMISLTGFDAVRNKQLKEICMSRDPSQTYSEWKFNARGIDLNRNFPSRLWKPKTDKDCPASENETKALIAVVNNFSIRGFLDFHSRGKSIYYYRSQMPNFYNERQFKIAKRIKDITKYELVPPDSEVDPGDSGGNTVHYFSEHFLKTALTIETVDEDAAFPLDNKYRTPTFDELKLVIFEFGSLII